MEKEIVATDAMNNVAIASQFTLDIITLGMSKFSTTEHGDLFVQMAGI